MGNDELISRKLLSMRNVKRKKNALRLLQFVIFAFVRHWEQKGQTAARYIKKKGLSKVRSIWVDMFVRLVQERQLFRCH
jgi:hypothetical protein